MDAGLAAVLGAAIGGGLAGLTAVGTGLFGLRTARLQLKHQESEAARQRRFESLRERREPRSKAYAELLDAGQEVLDLLRSSASMDDMAERIDDLYVTVRKRRAAVAIVGPELVAIAATGIAVAVGQMRNEVMHLRAFKTISGVEHALETFTRAARTALEDEGDPS
ncbi:hypothetical protein [Streptomyces cadmiisoli]|uniref:hypothetical protein n=1 Tax=Streptomyces cadmiisoli TaxID=2184053 RepID=UPI003D73ECFB